MEGLGEVEAPKVSGGDGAGDTCQEKVGLGNVGMWSAGGEGGLAFLKEVPAIVEVGAALDVVPGRVAQIITPDELAAGDAATLVVIHILDKGGAEVGRGGTGFDEAVLGVPDVSPNGLIFNVHGLPIPLCPLIAPFCLTPFHTNVLIAAWIMYEI